MQDFRVYIPINKGIVSKTHSQIVETAPTGEIKTRYRLQGIASTTALDRDSERVSKACMLDMARNIKAKRLPIFGNHQHEWENMLGYADDAEVLDGNMLVKIVTDYVETNPKVSQLIGKLEADMPLGLSIGGKVKDSREVYEPSLGKNIKMIDRIDLLETSIVGIAANPEASLSLPDQIAKSLKETETLVKYPPAGDLADKGKEILHRVYDEAKKKGYSDERAAKIAWGAVHRAGYKAANEEEIDMAKEFEDFLKSSGLIGISSYGKLGETTEEAMCPECGRPGELRRFEDGTAAYICNYDGTLFTREASTKLPAVPKNQPAKVPAKTIDQQAQEPLGRAKHFKEEKLKEGVIMKAHGVSKEAEAEAEARIRRKEAEADAEARLRRKETDSEAEEEEVSKPCKEGEAEGIRRVRHKEAEDEPEPEDDFDEDEEEEYKRVIGRLPKYLKRYLKEAEARIGKAEGIETTPGGEQAQPKYTIGGSDGAAKPVHAKSLETFGLMKKAIKENLGVEGLETRNIGANDNLSFKSMKAFMASK